jgi:hypothetical protein
MFCEHKSGTKELMSRVVRGLGVMTRRIGGTIDLSAAANSV